MSEKTKQSELSIEACKNGALVAKKIVHVEIVALFYTSVKEQLLQLQQFLGVEPQLKIKNYDVFLYIKNGGGFVNPNTVLVKIGETITQYTLEQFKEKFDVMSEISIIVENPEPQTETQN